MKYSIIILIMLSLTFQGIGKELSVQGWIILSNNMDNAIETIEKAKKYRVNQIQLSHQIVHNLKEVKRQDVCEQVNVLTELAHKNGVNEVLVWDHSFYELDYYPSQFRNGPNGTINLDNPSFWEWFKQDYRDMLDLIPEVDGLVLTFIETGAHAEKQYSDLLKTNQEKLASVVNAVADVVIKERRKNLYIRTFAYSDEEYENITGCLNHIKSDKIVLMMKEVPHDFFLTHPNDPFIGKINRPTIVEFDTGNEYNGQGVIANTWPNYVGKRWSDFINRPNVIGYVARTDRYGTTKLVGTPNEILLYTLMRLSENPELDIDLIYDEYISKRYGKKVLVPLKSAFKKAYDIVLSSMYILGTNVAKHSALEYEPYNSSYDRHVSGRWLNPPVVFVEHGINKEFHYWKDVINHIAPARFKTKNSPLKEEAKYVIDSNWVEPMELMDSLYLHYIIAEKQYGVEVAQKALSEIEQTKELLSSKDYEELYQLFKRTLLKAQLHEAVSSAYFGYRVYARGESFRYKGLKEQILFALQRIDQVTEEMKLMEGSFPIGQWDWLKDADTALEYKNKILGGWKEYDNVKVED
ncbi:MAG: hypothetical protein EGQ00_15450 [Parabacteroides johnsonii]|nr:hypothetical protein [Parabacteroides johnsonii]